MSSYFEPNFIEKFLGKFFFFFFFFFFFKFWSRDCFHEMEISILAGILKYFLKVFADLWLS